MDRNHRCRAPAFDKYVVALRKESVDRNHDGMLKYRDAEVALRKESVDRNCDSDPVTDKAWASLSARRAWIEILTFCSASFAVVGRSPQGERG